MQDFYISGQGNDDKNNGLTLSTPFRTISKAVYHPDFQPGSTIYVLDGVYDKVGMIFNKNGCPTLWTTIKNYPGCVPRIKTIANGINIFSSSYVRIEGLIFEGNRENITLEYALSQKDNLNNILTNANGIDIKPWRNSEGIGGSNPHHIAIIGNTVRNFPGGGIAFSDSDYAVVEKNIVSGNAWYTPHGCQGITALRGFNLDDNTDDYRITFQDNIVYDNQSLIPWKNGNTDKITEGHGIMLDTTQETKNKTPYTGKALITNNTCYRQGGSGIQVFQATNASVVNNSCYENAKVLTDSGEICVAYSKGVNVDSNTIKRQPGQKDLLIKYSSDVTYSNNLIGDS